MPVLMRRHRFLFQTNTYQGCSQKDFDSSDPTPTVLIIIDPHGQRRIVRICISLGIRVKKIN